MSLAQHRFVEGFVEKCASFGIKDQTLVTSLLKKVARDALEAVEQSYKKQGKELSEPEEDEKAGKYGVHAMEEDGESKAEEYPQRV